MSKSLGNIALVEDLLADAPGEALRLALQGHYRQTLDFTPSLQQSVKNLDRLYGVLRDVADIEVKDVAPPEGFWQPYAMI